MSSSLGGGPDGGATFDGIINLTGRNEHPSDGRVAISQNSNVYLVWHDGSKGILLTRSMDNGPTFEKPINLNNHSGWSINPQLAVPEDNKV